MLFVISASNIHSLDYRIHGNKI